MNDAIGGRRSAVGEMLRAWRNARGMSQLELAMTAGFSARHISFIETGRTRPSRDALLIVAEALEVPLRERNRLLEAGGYAHAYRHTSIDAAEMRRIRDVLQFMIDRHLPYPALVLDRYTNCVLANSASTRLVTALADASLISPHANHLRLVFHPRGVRRWIVNWEEVGASLLARAERELAGATDDEAGASLLRELRSHAGFTMPAVQPALSPSDLLLAIHIRKEDFEVRLLTTIMTIGTPRDVTLQELTLESFFPADEASERAWRDFMRDDGARP